MKLNIVNAGFLFVIAILKVDHAAGQEASILPPTPLQLIVDNGARQRAALGTKDLQILLQNHKTELFSQDYDIKKFSLLRELCEELQKSPQGKDFEPILLKEISDQKAIDRPPLGWDEIMMSSYGGGIGLLMESVIAITGEAGFNRIFDSVVTAEDPVKLKILLAQIVIRGERAKYDPILEIKLKSLQSLRLKEVIDVHLNTATTEK